MQLTILFDAPYWIGLLEVERDGCLYAARHIFGAEPSAETVYAFVLRDLDTLLAQMTAGVPVSGESTPPRRVNPKRLQREIRRELERQGVTRKAYEAVRVQLEANKHERRSESREERDAERAHRREIARAKAKARRKGR